MLIMDTCKKKWRIVYNLYINTNITIFWIILVIQILLTTLVFFLLKKIAKKLNLRVAGITNQRNFLTKLGILHRAEILAKNLEFSKKTDIYYRLKRLLHKNFMGELFKVMLITKKNIKFKMGF